MPTDFTLPELGENIAGGDVVRILVSVGDSVKKDQPVLELETDKATIEVPSTVSGTVTEVKIKQGEKVKVGQVVLTLDNGAAPASSASQRQPTKPRRVPREQSVAADKPKAQPAGAPEEGGLSQEMPGGAARERRLPSPNPSAARSLISEAQPATFRRRSRRSRPSRRGRLHPPRHRSGVSRASSASTFVASPAAVRPVASASTMCRRSCGAPWPGRWLLPVRPPRYPTSPSGATSSASR